VDADLADIEVGPGRPPQPSRSSWSSRRTFSN
jgi:hypothetical protein